MAAEAMASVAPIAADAVVKRIVALDSHDWNGVIKAYKTLRSDVLDEFLTVP